MVWRSALATFLLLAACAGPLPSPAPPGAATPRTVTLYRDTVTARMSDGTLCAAVREAGTGPWTGRFSGCPHPWPVRVDRIAAAPRVPLAPADGNPWVTLAAPAGPLGYAPRP